MHGLANFKHFLKKFYTEFLETAAFTADAGTQTDVRRANAVST